MKQIIQPKEDTRERVTILTLADCDVSYFCGSGKGGQAKNKVASGVQIKHRETGAIGRASDTRSQFENKQAAFKRMLENPRLKFWLAAKVYEVQQQETIQESVDKSITENNLKYEIRDEDGHWKEVKADYFNQPEAQAA